jgi:beta-glucanase (GH16 family)
MHKQPLAIAFAIFASLHPGCAQPAATVETSRPGWQLVWSDEFDQDGLPDASRWSYDVGGEGWGNRELQFYTEGRVENARVEEGRLIIEARREPWQKNNYTSARLVTKNKGDWSHGRFEVRARVPDGRGTWPAIWMLPTVWDLGDGKWPDNGEIDIMEHVGHNAGVIHASTHTRLHQWQKNTQRTATVQVPEATTAFHTYAMEWDAEEIRVYVDDQLFFTSKKDDGDWTSWPFYKDFHLILNVAVGGAWGGAKGVDDAAFPQRMEVDYVRVFQRTPAPPVAKP